MLSLKSISETLAVLGGVALMAGCASNQKPVNATEVDAQPAGGELTEPAKETPEVAPDAAATADAAPVSDAAPAATAAASAAPSAVPSAVASAAAPTPKKVGGGTKPKKKGAESKCGEGSCG
jgi:hypothetical protein